MCEICNHPELKTEDEHRKAAKEYRKNTYRPAMNKLSDLEAMVEKYRYTDGADAELKAAHEAVEAYEIEIKPIREQYMSFLKCY